MGSKQFTAQGVRLIEGSNTITAIATNQFGRHQNSITVTIDTTPPQNPTIVINEGEYTGTGIINLTLSAVGAVGMMISEDANFTGAVWENYSATKRIALTTEDGRKTVYVKYRDLAQNETQPVSDSIILDTTIPQIQITSIQNNQITNQRLINVTGTFIESNPNTIIINGIQAVIANNTFRANGVQLNTEGNNSRDNRPCGT